MYKSLKVFKKVLALTMVTLILLMSLSLAIDADSQKKINGLQTEILSLQGDLNTEITLRKDAQKELKEAQFWGFWKDLSIGGLVVKVLLSL